MAYCVQCGVELMQGAKKCPLCATPVYLPNTEQSEQPLFSSPKSYQGEGSMVSRAGVMFVITLLTLLPLAICFLCDININGGITWSPYVMGGLILFYTILLLPFWFRRPNPVIFSSVDFGAIALYLLMVDLITEGGWFLPFAFPVVGGAGLIVVAVITLCHYLRRGHLYIFGGACIATGGLAVLIEFLMNLVFRTNSAFIWSQYPLITLFIIGMGLIIIAICRPLRESLKKKFFI